MTLVCMFSGLSYIVWGDADQYQISVSYTELSTILKLIEHTYGKLAFESVTNGILFDVH